MPAKKNNITADALRTMFASFSWFLPAESVIDEDTLNYLFSTLEDGLGEEDSEEFIDFCVPLLMELFDENEEEARKECERAYEMIYGGDAGGAMEG